MAIIVINNYTEEKDLPWVKKIEEALNKEGKNSVIIWHFSEVGSREIPKDLEAIILSGSRAHLENKGVYSEYDAEVDLIMKLKVPVLGICFGHQLIGKAFGANIGSLSKFMDKPQNIKVLEPNEILKSWNIGDNLRVHQSHKDFVENVVERHVFSRIVETCSFNEIKQGIIDSIRDISYDVVREDYATVESKLKKAQRYAEAWILKKVTDALS